MTNITRWDPFRDLPDIRDAMDRMFDRGVVRPWRLVNWDPTADGFVPVDLYETDDEVVVKASLPGVKSDDVHISVTGDHLTIKGETREEKEETGKEFYRKERRYGSFQRVLTLPSSVVADQAKADFEDGVLELHLPKVPEVRPKTIEVKAKTP